MATDSDSTTLLHQLLSGTVFTGIGTVLGTLSGIVATKVIAVYLSSEDFGSVVLVEVIAMFLRLFSGFSIGIAAIKSLAEAQHQPDEQKTIVDTVTIFCLITFTGVTLLFLATKQWIYLLFGETPAENLTALILIYTLVLTYQIVFEQMLQGFLRFKQMAIIDLAASLLSVALLVVFLIWLQTGLIGAVIARVIATGVMCVLYYIFLPTKKGLSFRLSTLTKMIRFGGPLGLNNILTYFFTSFGTLVVGMVMTPTDVALLSVAGKIPSNITRLFQSFRSVYFPNLVRLVDQKDYRRAQKLQDTTLRGVAFLTALATAITIVFHKEIILLFFSDQYLGIGLFLNLSMLSLSISLVGQVLGNSTIAAGNSKAPPISNTINAIFTIAGTLILVPLFGIPGAISAGIIAYAVTNPINVWFLRRAGFNPKVMDYMKPLLLLGTLFGIYWYFQPESWLVRIAFLLVFVTASFLLSIIKYQDIKMIWDWAARILKRTPKLVRM